jgi:hypothetical protein
MPIPLQDFGQKNADQASAQIRAAAGPPDLRSAVQLLQPIIDHMLQPDANALGPPVTAQHRAHVTTIRRRIDVDSSSSSSSAAAAAAQGAAD